MNHFEKKYKGNRETRDLSNDISLDPHIIEKKYDGSLLTARW